MDGARTTQLSKALIRAGFLMLGGFHPTVGDDAPPLADGRTPDTLMLIGSAGRQLFDVFCRAREYADGRPDPLDRYTRRALSEIASSMDLEPVFVFDGPPYYPFQRYALRVGGFSPSPMGLLAHRNFGPWVALRAVFLSPEPFGRFESHGLDGPCTTCHSTPCIAACPAGALSAASGYDVPRCRDHLAEAGAVAACLSGCLARHACPVGQDYAHDASQGAFHMRSFLEM